MAICAATFDEWARRERYQSSDGYYCYQNGHPIGHVQTVSNWKYDDAFGNRHAFDSQWAGREELFERERKSLSDECGWDACAKAAAVGA